MFYMKVYFHKLNMDKMLGEETELLGRLPAWRYEKSKAVKNQAERMRSIAAGLLLVKALADVAGVSEEEVKEAEWGADASLISDKSESSSAINKERIIYVLIGGKKYYFNLSHSGEYVAVVAQMEPGIGIDIETKEDKNYKITKRMFCEAEKEYILGAEDESADSGDSDLIKERNKRFRNIWTKKESFLKCTGVGISVPLNSFTFDMERGKVIPAEGSESSYDMEGKTYFTETYAEEDYSLSVTIQSDERFALDIERVKVLV